MTTITQTELRNHIRDYVERAEAGETFHVLRNGKPVAMLNPIRTSSKEYWRNVKPLDIDLKGRSTAQLIIEEREQGW